MNHQISDTLVQFGGEVKALEEADGRLKVGGYVVLFGDPSTADLSRTRDYFTKSTDFGFDVATKGRVRWHHGLDPAVGRKVLGHVEFKTEADDVGIWAEGWIEQRTAYERKVGDWVKARKAGWSTGVAAHCVGRKAVGDAHEIEEWPLGSDVSITLTPADPRQAAGVLPLKSLIGDAAESPGSPETDAVPASLIDRLDGLVPDLEAVKGLVADAVASRGDRGLSAAKRSKVESLALALKSLSDQWEALASPPAAVPEPKATPDAPTTSDATDLYLAFQANVARLNGALTA